MAEETDKKNDEPPLTEDETMEGPDDAGDPDDIEGEEEAENKKGKEVSRFRVLHRFLRKRKWILLPLSGLILISLGWVIVNGYGRPGGKEKTSSSHLFDSVNSDNLYEEVLRPFFIPLPSEAPNRLVLVNFSVIWDGVASVRFKKRELQIREVLYEHLVKLAQKKKDLQEKRPYLESEIKRIFQEALGREGLDVKIKGIRAF